MLWGVNVLCCFLAYLVEEEHYFMETVELQGLSYEPELQDKTSGFSIVLSATLKTKVCFFFFLYK